MNNQDTTKYIYWLDKGQFETAQKELKQQGYRFSASAMTPCEVLRCNGKTINYATPAVFSRVCTRQGSWYRASDKAGKTLLVSDHKLDSHYDACLDATLDMSDFMPARLPGRKELKVLITHPAYHDNKPEQWERVAIKDKLMFKSLFTMTGFWKWGDNMKKHWLHHRSNHANFISKQYTTEIDNQQVAYSVTSNDGVCSSCVEFFNILEKDERKLVRACPGAITFGGAKRDIYYDVKPQRI